MRGEGSLDAEHLFAETDKALLVDLLRDACGVDLVPLKLIIRQSFKRLLASLPVDEPLPFEIEEGKDVDDLLLVEDAGLEA